MDRDEEVRIYDDVIRLVVGGKGSSQATIDAAWVIEKRRECFAPKEGETVLDLMSPQQARSRAISDCIAFCAQYASSMEKAGDKEASKSALALMASNEPSDGVKETMMEEKELYDAVLLEVFGARLDISIATSYAETAVKHRRKLFDPPITDPDPTSALVTAREIITQLTMALKPLADVADAADQGTIDSGDDGVLFDVKIAKLTVDDCRKARDLLARVVPR